MSRYIYHKLFTIYLISLHTTFGIQHEEPRCIPSDCNISNKLLMMEQEMKHLKETVESQVDVIDKLKSQVKGQEPHPVVAFMAELTTSLTGSNHRIYFDSVKVNQGRAYLAKHGLFIAPVNGTYQFSITACSRSGHYIVLEMMQSDTVLGKMLAGDTGYDSCNSKVILAKLIAGDDVYIQHGDMGDYLYANSGYGYPSFTGVLLHTT